MEYRDGTKIKTIFDIPKDNLPNDINGISCFVVNEFSHL